MKVLNNIPILNIKNGMVIIIFSICFLTYACSDLSECHQTDDAFEIVKKNYPISKYFLTSPNGSELIVDYTTFKRKQKSQKNSFEI